MGNQTTSQILYDGNRNVVMQFTGVSDGADPESNVVKVDMSALNPVPKSVKIMKSNYDVQGGVVQLLWAAADPVPFALLEGHDQFDYESIGGMVNGGGDTANGNILLSMLGFEAGSTYTIKLEMVKKFAG